MKRLLQLTNNQQEESVKDLLEKNRIIYKQSEYGIIDNASIWVMDSDYLKAKELLEAQISVDETLAKIQFNEEWKTKWSGSYVTWLFGSIRENPLRVFRLILLIAFVSVFLWYPIYTIFKK